MNDKLFQRHRLLLLYKGDISALVLFAQQADGSVCFPTPLPVLSSPMPEGTGDESKVSAHPSALLQQVGRSLQLDNDLLRIESGFTEYVETPDGLVCVQLARFVSLDPPHSLLQNGGCRLRTLPELRRQPPAELELLRRAYVKMIEG